MDSISGAPVEAGHSLVSCLAGHSVRDSVEGFLGAIEGCLKALAPDASPAVAEAVSDLRLQASSPFALFVCGEFNSGKSSLINALSGDRRCAVGVLPTTAFLEEVRTGDILFIDSPGLNSVIEAHQRASERYLVRADAVLFVTSVERPIAASEMRFLREITERWGKEVFIVLNKADSLSPADLGSVEQFLESSLRPLGIGADRLFSVSTTSRVGVDRLRDALISSLSNEAQLRLKKEAIHGAALSIGEEILRLVDSALRRLEVTSQRFGEIKDRLSRRIGDAPRIVANSPTSVEALFRMLADRLDDLIDERIGVVSVLRARVFGGKEQFRARVQEILSELRCEQRLEDEVRGTVERLDVYLRGVYDEFRAILSEGSEESRVSHRSAVPTIEVDLLTKRMNEAIESGLAQLLTAGSLAALSGVGAKISTVAPVEISATVAMIGLGTFSLRAFPRHRRRVKHEVRRAFDDMAASFIASLLETVEKTLDQVRQECDQWIEPRLAEVTRDLSVLREIAQNLRQYVTVGPTETSVVTR